MKERLATLLFVTAFVFAGCGGGGSTGGGGGGGGGIVPAPTPTPTPVATLAPQSNLPLQESVAGSMAWVQPTSHKTLYTLDVDTATGGVCTAGCLTAWPIFAPAAGSVNTENMTIVTRSDGAGQQWAYQLHLLYTFSGDSGPDQSNGDNFPDFGGHWHVARPGPAPTAAPGDTSPPCHVYC